MVCPFGVVLELERCVSQRLCLSRAALWNVCWPPSLLYWPCLIGSWLLNGLLADHSRIYNPHEINSHKLNVASVIITTSDESCAFNGNSTILIAFPHIFSLFWLEAKSIAAVIIVFSSDVCHTQSIYNLVVVHSGWRRFFWYEPIFRYAAVARREKTF